MTLMQVEPSKLVCPPVTMDDFMAALARIRPSVCDKDIEDHARWTEEFGQDA